MTTDQYYDYIGLAVLDVATANSSKGLMGLAELIVEVVRLLPELKSVSYNDVIEAVNRVSQHGLIPGIRTLRGGVKVVELRPLELRRDQADVINAAATKGYVSIEELMMQLKWSEDHARQVLSSLVDAGMAVADIRFSTGGRYYFPGLRPRDSTV
jgi:predicted HTH transcriptional regulator